MEPSRPDEIDRALIERTQKGLPLVPTPYQTLADQVGISQSECIDRMGRMLASGVIRRMGVIPNHVALGYVANGMSVWDVPDESARSLGGLVGAVDAVSHCYLRPRFPQIWPYNLFAMIHGRTRDEVEATVAHIAELLGPADRGHRVLYSTRLLKKAGLRLRR